MAANQAAIGLQEARLRGEQKRVARELDQRVEQRTRELAQANEELKMEIAERRRAEDALREGERESRLIVDTIPGLVAVLNPSGEIEFVSQPLLKYYGKSLEELQLWTEDDTIYSEDRTESIRAISHSITSGDSVNIEARFRRFDGVYRWFQVRGCPLRDRHGHISRWYFLHTDVDERKRAEEALKSRERDLKLIIDSIPALVWCMLPDGANEFISKRWHEYTGVIPEVSHGWGWQASFHPDDLPPLMKKWREVLASGEPGEIEARLRRQDGIYRWFSYGPRPFATLQGTSYDGTGPAQTSKIGSRPSNNCAAKRNF